MLMKAATDGSEGINKMHYEFINARTFISTKKGGGEGILPRAGKIHSRKGLKTSYLLLFFSGLSYRA